MKLSRTCLPVIFAAVLASIAEGATSSPDTLIDAFASITTNDLLKHVKVLSSDDFEGRAPASRGEERTVGYLIDHFRNIGLQPGNPDGSFVQKVPLMGVRSDFHARITLHGDAF